MVFSRFNRSRFNRFRRSNRRFSSSSNRFRRSKKSRIIGAKRVVNPMLLTSKNKTQARLNLPITPRYLTKFSYGFAGHTDISALNSSSGLFVMKFNSPYLPGNYTGVANVTFTGTANLSSVVTSPQSIATLQPAGYSQLCNANFYNRYRVGASSIKVTVQPSDASDVILLTVYPLPSNLSSNLSSNDRIASRAQQLPYSKERVCTINNDVQNNTIYHYLDVPSLEGKRKEQVLDDDQYQAQYNLDPTQINLWVVSWQTINGANLSGNLNFNVQTIYYTELSELTTPSQNTQTIE